MILGSGFNTLFAQWTTQPTGIEYNGGNVSTTGSAFIGTELKIKGLLVPRFSHSFGAWTGTNWMTITGTTSSAIHPACPTATPASVNCGTNGLGSTTNTSYFSPQAEIVNTVSGLIIQHTKGKELTLQADGSIRFWNGAILNPNAAGIQGPPGSSSPWVLDGANMRFSTGKVWIGSRRPTTGIHSNYRLAVDGKIVSNEIFTLPTADAAWADDVFDTEYILKSLSETETYITKNHHLEGIPSKAEVIQNGIDIGTMDAKLLRKIEEQYLHLIRMQKELDALKNELNQLKK